MNEDRTVLMEKCDKR